MQSRAARGLEAILTGRTPVLGVDGGVPLPTPTAHMSTGAGGWANRSGGPNLQTAVADVGGRMLPTPTTMDSVENRDLENQIQTRVNLGLQEVVRADMAPRATAEIRKSREDGDELDDDGQQLLPTPSTHEAKNPYGGPNHQRRKEEKAAEGINLQASLADVLLPTPTAIDAKNESLPPYLGARSDTVPAAVMRMDAGGVPDLLLPTPSVFNAANAESPEVWLERRADVQERTGTRHAPLLGTVAESIMEGNPLFQGDGGGPRRLLPTPNTMDGREPRTPEELQELKDRSPGGYANLRDVVNNEVPGGGPGLLPTPTVSDVRDGSHIRSRAKARMEEGVTTSYNLNHLFENDEMYDFHMGGRVPTGDQCDDEELSLFDVIQSPVVVPGGGSLLPTPETGESLAGHGRRGGRPGNGCQSGESLEAVAEVLAEDGSLLPTPRALDATGVRGRTENRSDEANARAGASLTDVARLLPTPTRGDGEGGGKRVDVTWDDTTRSTGDGGASRLRDVAGLMGGDGVRLIGTPTAGLGEGGGRRAAAYAEGRTPNPQELIDLLPTPTAQAAKHAELAPSERSGSRSQDDANLWVVVPRLAGDAPDGEPLLPTPATANSKSGRAMTASTENGRRSGGGQSSPLGLEETAALMAGEAPGNIPDYDDLPPASQRIVDGFAGGAGRGTVAPRPRFGPYEAAVRRWEDVLGREAPAPSVPGKNGRPRLNPVFVEWMMALPEGWVTSPEIGLPHNAQLKALGNGVVPVQAFLALHLLLGGE